MPVSQDLFDSIPPALVERHVSEYQKIHDHDLPQSYKDAIAKVEKVKFGKEAQRPAFDRGRRYHPEGLLNTRHKQDMFYAFETDAVGGLADYLYEYAGRMNALQPSTAWQCFIEDEKAPQPVVPFLIMSMHPDIVRALICGNLTSRFYSDSEFKQLVNRLTKPWDTPGVYFNQSFDRGSSNDKTNEGKGLSYDDWQNIYDDIVVYGDVRNPASLPLAKKVDYAWVPKKPEQIVYHDKTPTRRRYLENSRQKKLEGFLSVVDSRVLQTGASLDTKEKAQQSLSAPFEIGYSHDVANRLTEHLTNLSTNWLWGLLTAVIRVRFGDRFDINQGQLLYLCDPKHRSLGEALCTVLASGYYNQMGGNPTPAGRLGNDPPRASRGYRKNIKALLAPGGERYEGYSKAREFNKAIVALNKDLEEQEKVEPLAEAVAKAKVKRQEMLDQDERLRKRIQAMKTVAHMREINVLAQLVNPNIRRRSTEELQSAPARAAAEEEANISVEDAGEEEDEELIPDFEEDAIEKADEQVVVDSDAEVIPDSQEDIGDPDEDFIPDSQESVFENSD